jgi:ribosomal protection tetracycline resistance protein
LLHRTLNLGILAHVDAGKTTLTERLLHAAGIIDEIGSVDAGTTQTDSLALERQRGITIRSAVASFSIDDVTVNLIDTPGHPDFIAEVERVLQVLDGAVLVVSAVEGVQAQTRILMRALARLHVPTIIFVNKLDRRGADAGRTLQAIRKRLPVTAIALGEATGEGTRAAGFEPWEVAASQVADGLAEHDDAILEARVEERSVPSRLLRQALVKQTGEAAVHPVVFGSAVTGAGVPALMSAIAELLPAAAGEREGPAQATIFKIERGPAGEQIAYVRMFAGRLRVRDRLQLADGEHTVTAIAVFDQGAAVRRRAIGAGEIGRLWGLAGVRIGDAIGDARPAPSEHQFALPTLETVVTPRRPDDRGRLRVALGQLAEQDPLIDVRQDDVRRELSVSLYGEVQKEVIQATLEADFGVEVDFRESTTICVERVAGTGSAVERLHQGGNPFLATIGLRVEPAAPGDGVTFAIEAELGSMPAAFFRAVEDTVRATLQQGLHGWQVVDCAVAMTHSGYLGKHGLGHQYFAKSLSSTGADYRGLTPLVVMDALRRAGTIVEEPVHRFRLEIPDDTLGPVMGELARLAAVADSQMPGDGTSALEGEIPAAGVHRLRQRLPELTRGEGLLETVFDHHRPVRGADPERPRSDQNPLDREAYRLRVLRRVGVA